MGVRPDATSPRPRRARLSVRAHDGRRQVRPRAHARAARGARRPARTFPSFHVAGTNGKGSVVATLDALLRARGLRVGRYTSPHLVDFRERIVVDGVPIAEDDVVAFVAPRHAARSSGSARRSSRRRQRWRSTTSRARGVDVAVIETGLGGRLDSTNVLDAARRRRHVDRPRSHRVPRRHARGDRAREGRHLQARARRR